MLTCDIPTPAPRTAGALDGAAGARVYDLTPPPCAPLPDWGDDVATEDWENLFDAVRTGLRRIAVELSTGRASSPDRMQTCVVALEQLHLTLAHELWRRRELAMQVFDAGDAALISVRAGAGTPSSRRSR